MRRCIFCEIIAGRASAHMVYRDERVAALMDIHPVSPGHLLVIPVSHATFLAQLDEDVGGHLFVVAMRLGAALRAADTTVTGVNLHLADGLSAGQDVMHVHLHVIPRRTNDGLRWHLPAHLGPAPGPAALAEFAARIREAGGWTA